MPVSSPARSSTTPAASTGRCPVPAGLV